jgi:Rieske Fe-S protein
MSTLSETPTEKKVLGRRSFLGWLTYGLGAAAAALVGVPFIGYLFGARKAPVDWVPLGPLAQFPLNQTRRKTFDNPISSAWDGLVAHAAVYVRYQGQDAAGEHQFLVLAVNCAHLGCPVEWFQESGLFMCPCHGGVYYANGERASGPPPQGLFQCDYRVTIKNRVPQLEIQAPHYPTLKDPLKPQEERSS